MNTMQTRAVLAGAYAKLATMLTHSVEVDATGLEVRVLCSRVKLDSLADEYATDVTAAPTCPTCAKRLARRA